MSAHLPRSKTRQHLLRQHVAIVPLLGLAILVAQRLGLAHNILHAAWQQTTLARIALAPLEQAFCTLKAPD
jgi:hypothetical protein